MKYNIWIHIRLAGAVIGMVGAWLGSLPAVLSGFAILIYGTVMGLTRAEQILEELCRTLKNKDESK